MKTEEIDSTAMGSAEAAETAAASSSKAVTADPAAIPASEVKTGTSVAAIRTARRSSAISSPTKKTMSTMEVPSNKPAAASAAVSKMSPTSGVAKRRGPKKIPLLGNDKLAELIAEAKSQAAASEARKPGRRTDKKDGKAAMGSASVSGPPDMHVSPPEPAKDALPTLRDDANPIDRAIMERLRLIWDEEAGRWTDDMRKSLVKEAPRARVTRTTSMLTSHYVSRSLRLSGADPTWGQFMVMRTLFGPAICHNQPWSRAVEKRYPLATEDGWEAVVPESMDLVRDILDGKVGMPPPRLRKISVKQLGKEKSRKMRPSSSSSRVRKHDLATEAGGGGGGKGTLLSWREGGKWNEGEEEDAQAGGESSDSGGGGGGGGGGAENAWQTALDEAKALGNSDITTAIDRLQVRYNAQEARIRELQRSNDEICRSLRSYIKMMSMAQQI